MRRGTVIVVAAAAIAAGGAGGVLGSTAASGATDPSASLQHQSDRIAASLGTAEGRARYDLDSGRLVSVDVCVRGACTHRQFRPAPTCGPSATTCIDTALVVRKLPGGVTISAELA